MKLNTAGSLGDSIYQTLFMIELSEFAKKPIESINIQIDKKTTFAQPHVYGNVQLNEAAAEFLHPLFRHIFKDANITISTYCPEEHFDLDRFRSLYINFSSFDIRLWVYNICNAILPMDLTRKTISIDENMPGLENKILLTKSSRYCNYFLDWNVLKPFQKDIVFIGLESEWRDFCSDYFTTEFIKPKDAYEAAVIINSTKHYIANQTGLYSIAEMMKSPRTLCTAENMLIEHDNKQIIVPGPNNVIPINNGIAAQTTARLKLIAESIQYEV